MKAQAAASDALWRSWDKFLTFKIGDDAASIRQFPPLDEMPPWPTSHPNAPGLFGNAIGIACIKLCRPWALEDRESYQVDSGALPEIVEWLDKVRADHLGPNDRYMIRYCCLCVIGMVLDAGTNAPHLLPKFLTGIDAIDNAALHRMCIAALHGDDLTSPVIELLLV